MSTDALKAVLRDRAARTKGGATQIREMANIFDNLYGVSLPPKYLALQYLMGIDVLPLGRTMTLVGPPGCGKSVFGWFLSTIFAKNHGFVCFADAEDKTSMDQVNGIYASEGLKATDTFWRQGPKSQEQLFENLTVFGQEMSKAIAGGTKGCEGMAIMYFVDSINYLAADGTKAKRLDKNEQGSVGYGHAHKANALSEYLAAFVPDFISSWPTSLVTINHQKEKLGDDNKGGYGGPEKYEPGGVHKDFMYSLNIEFAKANSIAKHTTTEKRQGMTLKTKKNCFAEHGRQIGILMCTSQNKKGTGLLVDFEWGRALVDLLASGQRGWGGKDKSYVEVSALSEILEITRESAAKVNCPTLGMVGASPEDVGQAIFDKCDSDPVFYKALQRVLWITSKKVYNPKKWTAPNPDTKMSVGDARAILPLDVDQKKAPARKKRAAAPKSVPAPPAPTADPAPLDEHVPPPGGMEP
jgi:ABC-type oligopeptide transport system ATPase subunit